MKPLSAVKIHQQQGVADKHYSLGIGADRVPDISKDRECMNAFTAQRMFMQH